MQSKHLAAGGAFAVAAAAVVAAAALFGGSPTRHDEVEPAGVQVVSTSSSAPSAVTAEVAAPVQVTTSVAPPQAAAPTAPKPAKGDTARVNNEPEPTTPPAAGVPYDSDGHTVVPNPSNMAPGELAPKPPAPSATPPAPPIPTGP